MSEAKKRVPALEGWFEMDAEPPHLVGTRCLSCETYFFPKETFSCRNPACPGEQFEEVALSRAGKLWSFTDNRYKPPAPYMSADPFVPYIIAAVELDKEKMVVLGQVTPGIGIDQLQAGMDMELVMDTLYEDDENEYVSWKWQPKGL